MALQFDHIHSIIFNEDTRKKALEKDLNKHCKLDILEILQCKNESMTQAVKVFLEGKKSFCMGQIPTQCGWIVVGEYEGLEENDFYQVATLACRIAEICTYVGILINAYCMSEECQLEALGFKAIFNNDLGSLYHKSLIDVCEEKEEEKLDMEECYNLWEDNSE